MTAESNINKPEAARKSERGVAGAAAERRKSSGKTRHLSFTPPLQRSADKYRGQGTGKIISLRRQEEEGRGNQAEDWDDGRCRDGFYLFIYLFLFQYHCQAWAAPSLFSHFAPPTCDAQLCLLWFLALVIIRTAAEFGRALGRRFLGRAVWLENKRNISWEKHFYPLDFFSPPFFFFLGWLLRATQISRLGGKESVKNVAFAWNTCTENPLFSCLER